MDSGPFSLVTYIFINVIKFIFITFRIYVSWFYLINWDLVVCYDAVSVPIVSFSSCSAQALLVVLLFLDRRCPLLLNNSWSFIFAVPPCPRSFHWVSLCEPSPLYPWAQHGCFTFLTPMICSYCSWVYSIIGASFSLTFKKMKWIRDQILFFTRSTIQR